ncbi:predicted protein [Arabidopsis lyrata subsp. lyrata]|uniref:Predicted protein n=1 Tax=Arabidopsis lyrata subsp. lyrata TaxID=81972 RepID=D7LJG4_ARALL|nr:predicted protein [Arabidopsis lyrata subsp. lyrata]
MACRWKSSILSKRFITLESEEASSVAKSIEDEAYAVASAAVISDDDEIEILKTYSKEISKRMLESVKAKTNVASPPPKDGGIELAADSRLIQVKMLKKMMRIQSLTRLEHDSYEIIFVV